MRPLASSRTAAPGPAAPDFALVDQHGVSHRLEDYRGGWLVLYFYPRADTPGCRREACAFRDALVRFRRLGARVLGVSLGDRERHRRFAEKYQLGFPLLADRSGQVARAYGTLWSLGPLRVARRRTFLIDPEGMIARTYRGLRPTEHPARALHDLERLRAERPLK